MELVNETLTPLQIEVERAIVSADSLITSFNQVLNPETRNNIAATFEDLSETVRSLKETSQSLSGIIGTNSDKMTRTFTNLEETSVNFNRFSDTLANMNISGITQDIEKVIADFEKISNNLSSGQGTAGKLLNDNSVYDNLDRATKQMEQLLQDIKLNPKRYVHFSVFGKSPGPYDPPRDSLN